MINATSNSSQALDGVSGHSALIIENSIIYLGTVGQMLNVRADINSVGSVAFDLDGGTLLHVENIAPYALASDSGGVYNAWTPSVGAHTLKATAYSGSGESGTAGTLLFIHFSVSSSTYQTPTPTPTATPTPTPGAVPTGYTSLISVNSNKCIDILGASTSDGGTVDQYTCNSQNNQLFSFVSVGSGRYQIVSKSSGKCLDIAGASTANGAVINQYGCVGANQLNQLFTVNPVGSNTVSLISVQSGKCVEVPNASTADSMQLDQWDCSGMSHQSWKFQ